MEIYTVTVEEKRFKHYSIKAETRFEANAKAEELYARGEGVFSLPEHRIIFHY